MLLTATHVGQFNLEVLINTREVGQRLCPPKIFWCPSIFLAINSLNSIVLVRLSHLAQGFFITGIDIPDREQQVPRLKVSLANAILVKEFQPFQGVPENAFCHLEWIFRLTTKTVLLVKFQKHLTEGWAHRFKNQAFMRAIRAFVFKLSEKLRGPLGPFQGSNLGKMVQDLQLVGLFCLVRD